MDRERTGLAGRLGGLGPRRDRAVGDHGRCTYKQSKSTNGEHDGLLLFKGPAIDSCRCWKHCNLPARCRFPTADIHSPHRRHSRWRRAVQTLFWTREQTTWLYSRPAFPFIPGAPLRCSSTPREPAQSLSNGAGRKLICAPQVRDSTLAGSHLCHERSVSQIYRITLLL
jgi:hypothetical protein